ncbi:ketopantoate reductase family protein [Corynebacterium durum]|jgi:2-dehydropantoate 2-reductase|uniref:ketopantoate reductase family protein n=1 Tax=Corynebacterium durum TaxID=61592 RepID=UPI0015CEC88F|nr:ketopantoate reductase C-terminal domain-containing protein [Corynebacterium durum]NYI74043.1 2-dehydropantoate 2-reductase [Corynebacterium durum]WJY85767.1 2-dehydropantoate 2-reductase [Corynebacterium durum]
MTQSVAIVGSGGIGGLLAAVCAATTAAANTTTTQETTPIVVTTPRSARRITAEGLRLTSPLFGDSTHQVRAVTQLEEPVDFTFITVKQPHLTDALRTIPAEYAGTVIPLLNGVDHMQVLRAQFDSLLAGSIHVESSRDQDGTIVHGCDFVRLTTSASLPPLFDARVTTITTPNQDELLWSKLAVLAPFALMTARYRIPLGEVLETRRQELEEVVGECAAVSVACGGPDTSSDAMGLYEKFEYGAKSSMLRDIEENRPTELDAIGGAVIRHAAAHGIIVPAVGRLVAEMEGII